jgi:Rieske Fe-S protein
MQRRDFIRTTCISCLAGSVSLSIFEGCGAVKIVKASIVGSDLFIPLSDFQANNGDRNQFEKYVIARNEMLQYPICIYRIGDNQYTALWMKCSHQGSELQAFGERLECPAHGSTFDNKGTVLHGPAADRLKSFPIIIENNQLKISLR